MNLADELRKLTELREAGHLTEQEFAEAKRRLLAETGAQSPQVTPPPPLPQQSPQPKKSGGLRGCLVIACVLVGGVVLLGIVISAISKLGNTTATAKSMRVQADIQAIKTQLQLYKNMSGFYPTTEQGLQALVTQPQNSPRPTSWYQLFKEMPKDPWGSDYIYRYPGVKNPAGYDLFSAGSDRQPDTADDDLGSAPSTASATSGTSTSAPSTASSAPVAAAQERPIPWREIDSVYNIQSKQTNLQKDEAWKRYKGKRVTWSGEVTSVSEGWFGGLTLQVKMNRNTFTSDLLIHLNATEKSKAAQLQKGDQVRFTGILKEWGSLMPITLDDGEIIQ
jgi:general secretion pathway protein G